MDLKNFEYFYINGCSHTEGGGLEDPSIRINSVRPYYEKFYNITWQNKEEVNMGYRLSQIIGLKCVNESMSGGGAERVVRMTYEFINKNWSNRDKFFIILEKPDSSRYEFYFQNEYYLGNSIHNNTTKKTDFLFATRNFFDKEKYNNDKLYQKFFLDYHDNFFDFEENLKKCDFAFAGLYSFCKRNKIKIFLMMYNDFYFNENYDIEDIIEFSDINSYCYKNKLTIKDETNGEFNDYHPGFFGHIEYAKKLSSFLGWSGGYSDLPDYYNIKKNVI